jgi:hypothetical protein
MPRYYSGANVVDSASEGLLAGFAFVDNLRARRRALDLQEREQARADERMALARLQDRRAQEQHDLALATGQEQAERARILFDQQQEERSRLLEKRAQNEAERGAFAKDLPWGRLVGIGQSVLRRATPSPAPAQAAAPAAATTAATAMAAPAAATTTATAAPAATASTDAPATESQPAAPAESAPAPVDLREARERRAAEPGLVGRVKKFVADQERKGRENSAKEFWRNVTNLDMSDAEYRYSSLSGAGAKLGDVRTDPAKFAYMYLKDRDAVDPTDRATLDLTMSNALKERSNQIAQQIQSLDPNDQRNQGRIKALTDQYIEVNRNLDELSKAVTKTAARDAGITRPVKPEDPRVVPAIVQAVEKAREVQPIISTTPDELRAARQIAMRASNAPRLTERQIQALTTLYMNGEITTEEIMNWSLYGQPIAPKQPTIQPLGDGYYAVVTENGITLGGTPTAGMGALAALAKARGGNAEMKDSEVRLRQKENLTSMFNIISGAVKNGDLDGDPNALMGEMLQVIGRTAGEVQSLRNIPLIDQYGAVRFHMLSPTEVAELTRGFIQYYRGEVDTPWYRFGIPRGQRFVDYLPESPSPEQIEDWTQGVF